MITVIDGDLLTAGESVIGHQTNCHGVMGAGVALQLKRKYPHMFDDYRQHCNNNHCAGTTRLFRLKNGQYIANIFGQYGTGFGKQTDEEMLECAVNDLIRQMKELGLTTLALPYGIGCGLGGGEWKKVYGILVKCFTDSEADDSAQPIDVVLYKLESGWKM